MTVGTDTIQIGRVGAALGPVDPENVEINGARVSFSGDIFAATATEAQAYVEQLRGYVENPDEPFVPVRWTGVLPNMDGFYRVTGMSASQQNILTVYRYSMTLERVRGFAAPLFETRILGAKRTGVDAGVTAVAWHAVPLATQGYDNTADPTATGSAITIEDGDRIVEITDTTNSTFDTTIDYYLPPASWYVGAATLTVDDYHVVGRQCANSPDDWTLSNGVVRVSAGGPVNVGDDDASFVVEWWDPIAEEWVDSGTWRAGWFESPTDFDPFTYGPHAITVLRNSPECTAIRLSYEEGSLSGSGTWAATVDLSLRRGSHAVEVTIQSRQSEQFALHTSPTAGFDLDGAGTASGTGALVTSDGWAVALGNSTADTTYNVVKLASAGTRLVAGIGHATYSGTYDATDATAFAARHAAAQVESVQVVAR